MGFFGLYKPVNCQSDWVSQVIFWQNLAPRTLVVLRACPLQPNSKFNIVQLLLWVSTRPHSGLTTRPRPSCNQLIRDLLMPITISLVDAIGQRNYLPEMEPGITLSGWPASWFHLDSLPSSLPTIAAYSFTFS